MVVNFEKNNQIKISFPTAATNASCGWFKECKHSFYSLASLIFHYNL
jgi:hypothetical protein